MEKENRKLYVAYGANLSKLNMLYNRCKNANLIGKGFINNHKLVFRSVANIEKSEDSKVPVVVWSIDNEDEKMLDKYEGVAYKIYRKEQIEVHLNTGEIIKAMVYILNEMKPINQPSLSYFNIICSGYIEHDLDVNYLFKVLKESNKV